MASIAEALEAALQHHRAGDLAAAAELYRRILAVEPGQPDALYLSGMAALQQGRSAEAADTLRRACAARPGDARARHGLGLALAGTGDLTAAADSFREAARLDPGHADALNDLGTALGRLGDAAGAEAALERAAALGHGGARRNLAGLLLNRASALLSAGDAAAADGLFHRARALDPAQPEAPARHGLALRALGLHAAAADAFGAALELRPDDPDTLANLGDALTVLGRLEEAEAALRRALALRPGAPEAANNLGNVLHATGRLGQAADLFLAAIAADPGAVEARTNLGTVLRDLGDDEGAERCYRAALALRPDDPDIHWQRALARLTAGDLETGWAEYEWRWRTRMFSLPPDLAAIPDWAGGDPAGLRLLLHAEQGHGDTLQFCRYAPLLAAKGARRVGLLAQPALVRLLRDSFGGAVEVMPLGTPVAGGDWDARAALMGLPYRCGTRLDGIPAEVSYLKAPEGAEAGWRARLPADGTLKVGLVWAGDPRRDDLAASLVDRRRSLDLAALAPLAAIPGLSFHSLQKGEAAAQAALPGCPLRLTDWTGELNDFADTAGLVAALDLVVTVDTAVAHLAGGLGRPVRVLSRLDGCWRWLRDRSDSPWYPSLRLYRQRRWGDWEAPVRELAADLRALAAVPVPSV